MWDDRSSSPEIAKGSPEIAVFGIGAIEQHSAHLPLCTDWYQVREVSRRVAEELGAFLIPALPFSMSQCHGPAPGTVWLSPETLAAVVRDVIASLRSQGIRKVVLINGHGGNFVLEPLIRELNLEWVDISVVKPLFDGGFNVAHLFEHGDVECHAGEIETSLMLAISPSLVKPGSVDYVPSVGREFFDYAFLSKWSPDGVIGIPSAADAAKGRRALDAAVKSIVESVEDTFAVLDLLKRGRGGA
jgi:creatinine amidohydrolase